MMNMNIFRRFGNFFSSAKWVPVRVTVSDGLHKVSRIVYYRVRNPRRH